MANEINAAMLLSMLANGDANALAMVQNALAKSGKRITKSATPKTPSDVRGEEIMRTILGDGFDAFFATLRDVATKLVAHAHDGNVDTYGQKIQITLHNACEDSIHGPLDAGVTFREFSTQSFSPKYVAMLKRNGKMA